MGESWIHIQPLSSSPMSSPSGSLANEISLLIDAVYQEQQTLRSSVGALAWLTYDILITYDEEVEHVWGYVISLRQAWSKSNDVRLYRKRWNLPKTLYFIGRYFGLLYLMWASRIAIKPNVSTHSK